MITFIKQRDELPNYENLYHQEPNTEKMLHNCKILNNDKKQIIDTSQIQKQYRWQGSIPHNIRDTNLNIKNDPKNIFKSRKNSCNNSMMSTQRADVTSNYQDKINIVKGSDFSNSYYVRKPSTSNGTTVVMTEIKSSPEKKQEERYYIQQISVRNSQVKGTSMPGKRQVVTESDEQQNKSIAIKYIGVHNDVIGILSRKVPIQIEREKLSMYLKNKDQRKCKSRQSTRQSTCPGDQSFSTNNQFTYQDFIGTNTNYPKPQSEKKNSFSQQEQGKRKISLREYEDFVSKMTNQFKNQQENTSDNKKLVYTSLQNSMNNQNISLNNNFLTQNNMSSHDSTPMQTKLTPNQKRVFFDESLRQSTDNGPPLNPMNQNYITNSNQAQKRCETEYSNQKSPLNMTSNNIDFRQNLNLYPITPQKLNVLSDKQQNINKSDMVVEHKQFRTKRAMSSQARRLDSNEKDEILKQIHKIQNQKYKEYIQENLSLNQQFYQSFQTQKKNLNAPSSPLSSQKISPRSQTFNNQENFLHMPDQPNPQKYDTYVINKYAISKRLKPIVKQKENGQKYSNISNVQVEWVNSEKKVTYF